MNAWNIILTLLLTTTFMVSLSQLWEHYENYSSMLASTAEPKAPRMVKRYISIHIFPYHSFVNNSYIFPLMPIFEKYHMNMSFHGYQIGDMVA